MMLTEISAKALRELRLTVDKTQSEMGNIFCVSRETWNRWETKGGDQRVASHVHMYAIIKQLEIKLEELEHGISRIDGFGPPNYRRS